MLLVPDYLLFAQHGWADTPQAIASLAMRLAEPQARVIAPDLGWLNTWLWFEPLVNKVEQVATQELARYPETPLRIVGHSMGGLIWLELLTRHPDWRSRVHSLVLIASPLGGADLAHLLARFSGGLGISRALSQNRRSLAEAIAQTVPTLTITGDSDGGSDGTVIAESTRCAYAQNAILPLNHARLKNHPDLIPVIQAFWANPQIAPGPEPTLVNRLVQRLRSRLPLFDAHRRDFPRAQVLGRFPDGTTLRTWRSPFGLDHIFLGDPEGRYAFGGFVESSEAVNLQTEIAAIIRDYARNPSSLEPHPTPKHNP